MFVAYVAKEGGGWGLAALNQVAKTLKAVAGAIVWALNAVLNHIVSLVKAALNAAVAAIWTACTSYANSLNGDIQRSYSDLQVNGSISGANSNHFWRDFGGSVFLVALALGVVVEVVLVVVTDLSLGAGFVAAILLSVLLTSLMATLLRYASLSLPAESGYSRPSGGMVWGVAQIVNTTPVNGSLPPDKSNTNYTPTWKTIAETFGWSWTLFGLTVAWGALMGAFLDPTGIAAPAVALALSVVGIVLALVDISHPSQDLTFLGLGVAGLSVGVDFYGLSKPKGRTPGNLALNTITAVGDTASLAILIVENHDRLP